MTSPENRLFCRLDGLTVSTREQQRLKIISELGLLDAESIPIFEEAIQTAAHFLEAPICFLGIMLAEQEHLKATLGLSRAGLMNELATSRRIPRAESFCTYVVDSHQRLVIPDTLHHPAFANSLLVHQYGIRAYLGVPLLTSDGTCLGTLAVMDLSPCEFTTKEVQFLELTARWAMSEYARSQANKAQQFSSPLPEAPPSLLHSATESFSAANQLKVELLNYLTQELRTPLTSVMGMTSVLTQEIYGPLTSKQKEYLDIIHNSGQYLLSLVNEILELAELDSHNQCLNLVSVDIEMLCQQSINTLEQAASRRDQQIRLTVEPGHRIWLLDKDKIRQMLYHLVFSVIQSANAGSIIRIHVSHKGSGLNITLWVSHPWLGDGIPCPDFQYQTSAISGFGGVATGWQDGFSPEGSRLAKGNSTSVKLSSQLELDDLPQQPLALADVQGHLGLVLSRQLVELHGGKVSVLGSPESGYRYVIYLPKMNEVTER
jgi:signal transduction histidine kinase